MRIVTFNANGVRSAARKGFFEWFADINADILCMQETRAQRHQLEDPIFTPQGYHCHYRDAERPGYAGTAIFSRLKPERIGDELGWQPADEEGRWVCAEYPGLHVASLYMPSGSSGEHRQAQKFRFMEHFFKDLRRFMRDDNEYIICADWNICHREIDLKNWRANQNNSGFLPEERAWLDKLYEKEGWSDAFRLINPDAEQYTWWSNRGRARQNNVGWRLDYPLITPGLKNRVKSALIYKEVFFSDHAPLIMDYDMDISKGI